MKKIYCILLLFVIFLTGTSCSDSIGESSVSSNEDSDLSIESSNVSAERELPKMLLADNTGFPLPEGFESDFSIVDSAWINENLVGTVVENPIEFDGNAPYYANRIFSDFSFDHIFYGMDGRITLQVNSESGIIVDYAYRDYMEDHSAVNTEITIDEAKAKVLDIINQYYDGVINISEYKLVKSEKNLELEAVPVYLFAWEKRAGDVLTGKIEIEISTGGILVELNYDERDQAEEKIPDYTKEEYLEACRKQLQDMFDKVGYMGHYDVKITSLAVYLAEDLQSSYMRDIEKYCVECPLYCEFEYGEGQTGAINAFFYLPYADSSDVKQ